MGNETDEINVNQDDIKSSLAQINGSLDEITKSLRKLHSRVDVCETSNEELHARLNHLSFGGYAGQSPPESGIAGSRPGDNSSLSVNIQGDFRSLKESYQKIQLSSEVTLNAEKSGIRREDQPRYNVIVNAARYSETVLKVLTERASGTGLSREHCDEIATIALAQQRYLQEEYASLLVNSSFNAQTAKLFKQLQRNS